MTAVRAETMDQRLMGLALAMGRRNLGLTWPNPSVGAVVADSEGRIVATGTTAPGGRPHAEPIALDRAGKGARGATLFVSLEPCSHHGRTPPCTDAIVAAGIRTVVAAHGDPDLRVAGRGYALLASAGIEVVTGIRVGEAAHDHVGHLTRTLLGRPHVTCKIAATRDGFAARFGSDRLLITEEGANVRMRLRRAYADAILVGISTVLADDPRLDVRLAGLEDRDPVRLVLDSRLRLPIDSRFAREAAGRPCWVLCAEGADRDAELRLLDAGVEVLRVPAAGSSRVDLAEAARMLAARGLTRILAEAGPTLANALAEADLIDDMIIITNDRPLGEPGLPAIGRSLAQAIDGRFARPEEERVGEDMIRTFTRRRACSPGS